MNLRKLSQKCFFSFLIPCIFAGCSTFHTEKEVSQKQIRKIYSEIGNISAEIRSIYSIIGEFQDKLGTDFIKFYEETGTNQGEITKNIIIIREELGTYKGNQADSIQEIQALSDMLQQISSNMDEYAYKVSSMAQRLDSIDARITQLSNIYRNVSEREDENSEVKAIREKEKSRLWNNLGSGIVGIQTDLAQLKVKILTLQEDISSIVSALPRKKGDMRNKVSRSVIIPTPNISPPVAVVNPSTKKNVVSTKSPPHSRPMGKSKVRPVVSSRPDDLYESAKLDYLKGNFSLALSGFRNYVEKYPDTELAPNAQYWIGECHYSEGEYKKAVESFNEVLKRYPKSRKIPSALLKKAYSYLKLKKVQKAVELLNSLITDYPNSGEANLAGDKIKELGNK